MIELRPSVLKKRYELTTYELGAKFEHGGYRDAPGSLAGWLGRIAFTSAGQNAWRLSKGFVEPSSDAQQLQGSPGPQNDETD